MLRFRYFLCRMCECYIHCVTGLVNVTSKKNIYDCGKILTEYGCNLLKKDI